MAGIHERPIPPLIQQREYPFLYHHSTNHYRYVLGLVKCVNFMKPLVLRKGLCYYVLVPKKKGNKNGKCKSHCIKSYLTL